MPSNVVAQNYAAARGVASTARYAPLYYCTGVRCEGSNQPGYTDQGMFPGFCVDSAAVWNPLAGNENISTRMRHCTVCPGLSTIMPAATPLQQALVHPPYCVQSA
jgi:hypothetical protein